MRSGGSEVYSSGLFIRSSIIFLAVPVVVVIAVNVFFLCQVIMILRSKLERDSHQPGCPSVQISFQSTRAVFILIPIFGLQFLLLPIRPSKGYTCSNLKCFITFGLLGSPLEYFYEIISSLSTSSQGITVSILLCFSNKKIISQIKQTCSLLKLRLRQRISMLVISYSRQHSQKLDQTFNPL